MHEFWRIMIVLAASTVGTMGIILQFGIEKRVILWALISSILCCGGYEITYLLGGDLFISSFVGSAISAAFSDVMAHYVKVPATVMIIPGIVPLVPGGKLYYTMLGAVSSDKAMYAENGKDALLIAAGLAMGIIAVTAVSKPVNEWLSERRLRKAAEYSKNDTDSEK
jgi:uncharacterized membrane protein YjjB (DUF3815 family)